MKVEKGKGIAVDEKDGCVCTSGGRPYWDAGFQQLVRKHLGDFCPGVSFTRNGRDENGADAFVATFSMMDDRGRELCGDSASLEDGVKIPQAAVAAFQEQLQAFHKLAQDPQLRNQREFRQFIEDFRLPDPMRMKNAWRMTRGKHPRLLVLWGWYDKCGGLGTTFLPKSTVSGAAFGDGSRDDVMGRTKPFVVSDSQFALAKWLKRLVALAAIFLAAAGLWWLFANIGGREDGDKKRADEMQKGATNKVEKATPPIGAQPPIRQAHTNGTGSAEKRLPLPKAVVPPQAIAPKKPEVHLPTPKFKIVAPPDVHLGDDKYFVEYHVEVSPESADPKSVDIDHRQINWTDIDVLKQTTNRVTNISVYTNVFSHVRDGTRVQHIVYADHVRWRCRNGNDSWHTADVVLAYTWPVQPQPGWKIPWPERPEPPQHPPRPKSYRQGSPQREQPEPSKPTPPIARPETPIEGGFTCPSHPDVVITQQRPVCPYACNECGTHLRPDKTCPEICGKHKMHKKDGVCPECAGDVIAKIEERCWIEATGGQIATFRIRAIGVDFSNTKVSWTDRVDGMEFTTNGIERITSVNILDGHAEKTGKKLLGGTHVLSATAKVVKDGKLVSYSASIHWKWKMTDKDRKATERHIRLCGEENDNGAEYLLFKLFSNPADPQASVDRWDAVLDKGMDSAISLKLEVDPKISNAIRLYKRDVPRDGVISISAAVNVGRTVSGGFRYEAGAIKGGYVSSGEYAKARSIAYDFFRSIPQVRTAKGRGTSFGTAFAVTERDFITNYHVVSGAVQSVVLKFADPNKRVKNVKVRVVSYDMQADLAWLQADEDYRVSPLPIASGAIAHIGENVVTLGYPYDSFDKYEMKVGKVRLATPRRILHDAEVLPGNSGGPLVSVASGMVIGVTDGVHYHDKANERYYGKSNAIPIAQVFKSFPQLKANTK